MGNNYFRRRLRVTLTSKLKGESLIFGDFVDIDKNFVMQGKIIKYPFTQMDELDLTIYNLNPITRGNIIAGEYFDITIEAGYYDGNFGQIYKGYVLRVISGDEDAITTITRFICTDSKEFYNLGFINATFDESSNFYEIAEYIAANGSRQVSVELDERLKNYQAKGGRTLFGSQYDELAKIAEDANFNIKVEDNVVKIFGFDDFSNTTQTAIVLNANTGMVGIPTLTNNGVEVKALMNPKYQIYGLIKLNNSEIRNEQDEIIPNRELGAFFSSDGLYKVIKMVYNFDNKTGPFDIYITALSRDVYESLITSG